MRKDPERQKAYWQEISDSFYRKVDSSIRIDREFAELPRGVEDEPLTEEEIAQIDAFWGKYSFAYPNIDYKSFETFKNRSGKFSVYHCPGAIRTSYFSKHFVNPNYQIPFQNKALFDFTFPDIRKPRTVARRMLGIYYDGDFNPLTLEETIDTVMENISRSDMLVKPSGAASSGGHGIVFLTKANTTPAFLRKVFTQSFGSDVFVVQEKITQSAFMSRLNDSSVNTIRITSFLHKGKVTPLAALIRVGKSGNNVDAFYSGGEILGIDMETGACHPWAMASDHTRVTVLPSGVRLDGEPLVVPNFEIVKKAIVKAHYRMPYIKLISWDIALGEDDLPIFIECNFAGMIQLHEAVNGPLFGDLMPELLDEYLLDRFFVKFATDDFICKEYHDHVVVEEYIGSSELVEIPDTLRDKPVTLVETNAFKGCAVKRISASPKLLQSSKRALSLL